MTTTSEQTTVLYILGNPYSGSTLFSLSLGTINRMLNLGEVVLLENDYNNGYGRCLCGKQLKDCAFWSLFVHRYCASGQSPGLDFKNRPRERLDPIDRSSVTGTLAELCGISPGLVYGRAAVERYRRKAVNFIRDAARLTGARFVVDASKMPRRLQLLIDDPQIDVRVVWIAKPLHSAYASRLKRARRRNRHYTPLFAPYYVLLMLVQHLRLARAFQKTEPSRRTKLALSSLVEDPQHVEGVMSALLGTPIRLEIEGGILSVGDQHVFTGNRWITAQTQPLRYVPLKLAPDPPLSLFERWSYALFSAVLPVLRS